MTNNLLTLSIHFNKNILNGCKMAMHNVQGHLNPEYNQV